MTSWRDQPGPARAIGKAVKQAVDTAAANDRSEFEQAAATLTALPAEQTGLVLGAVVRMLLEDQHIDGIDADDIRQVLARCYQQAATWLPPKAIEVESLVAVLSSALGIHEPGVTYQEILTPVLAPAGPEWVDPEIPGTTGSGAVAPIIPTTAQYSRHAPLLIADLLESGRRTLVSCLDRAFDDIARFQTMEMP